MAEVAQRTVPYAYTPIVAATVPWMITELVKGTITQKRLVAQSREELASLQAESNRSEFYYRLYSEIPFAIQRGLVSSSHEALEKLPQELVNSLSPEDLDSVRQIMDGMVAAITGVTPLPEMAKDMPELEMPELVVPTEIEAEKVPLATLNRLTIDEIIKALVPLPSVPSPILSEEAWAEYLSARQGGVDDPEVDYLESEAENLIASWKERDNQLTAYREGIAEMPDYTLVDMLKEMVVQPGLALMEVAMIYFEHVSMPLAGALYKTFIPDLEKKYQEYRQTESTWKALAHAWEEWDSPGEGAWEWILKYILMEGVVDPLSYVGWGIATKLTKPLGKFGRMVGAAERGAASVLELPFDLIKAGLKKLPKSLSQRAALQQAKSIQFVQKWVEKYTGKSVRDLSKSPDGMVLFNKATERAIRHAMRYPQADSDIARAGRVLLEHTPVDEKMLIDWSNRLAGITGRTGLFTPETTSRELVDNINSLFEDYFTRGRTGRQKITVGEAARELLVRLNIENTDDAWKLAQRVLDDRVNDIVGAAKATGLAKSPVNAIYSLAKRNFRYYIKTEESAAYLARKQMGVFAASMQDVSLRAQQVWRFSIDRWVVRPFAESYLCFALYGPMNMIEDIFRSALGGVRPNRFNPARFSRKWAGVSYDPNLMRDAWSETLGELRTGREAMQTNWILSIFGLAKPFGELTYKVLVEKPGQIGIGFRRGFVDGRATQILKEMGGDTFERLVKIDAPRPRLKDKKFANEVYQAVNDLKLSANPDSIRYSKELFTRETIHKGEVANILSEHPDMPRAVRDKLVKDMDEGTLIGSPEQITTRMDESRDILMDDFIRSPERASEQMKELANFLTDLEIRNPEEMSRVMYSLNYMAQVQGAVPKQVMRRVTQRSRGLPFAERSASINADMDRLSLFLEKSKGEMQRVADKIKADLPNISEGLVPSYGRYYDTLMAKSINASDNRMADIARRREYFARATAQDLKDSGFWEQFYLETDSFWERFDLEQLDFDDLLQSVAREMGEIQGVKYPTRPAVKVTDRALSPQDVATVMQVRMDDITKSLMESMMLRQDRARFVRYVMHHTTPDDVGFTPESVGTVYDQILWSLQADPRTVDWMTPRLKELQDINNQLHQLYNSKLLPDDEIAEIGRYVDDIANQVEKTVYKEPFADLTLRPEITRYSHKVSDVRRIASGTGTVKLYHGAPTEFAERLVKEGPRVPYRVEDVAREVAERYGLTWKEFYRFAYRRHETVGGLSTATAPVASRWGQHFPIGEVLTDLNSNARLVARAKEIKLPGEGLTDAYNRLALEAEELARKKGVAFSTENLADLLRLPDKYGLKQRTGALVELEVDVSKLPKHIRRSANQELETLSRGEITEKELLDLWNHEYKDFKISPDAIRASKIVVRDMPQPRVIKGKAEFKTEFKDYNSMRQTAMDEAHKWYYKEFTDYTNANVFDAIMKTIYPYWTYESQRLFWLPRSFVRHPGTFTAFERWQNNTDYGYIHIPGTSMDYNPWRGTVYGTLTTRLARRDFPEYYDEFGVAGDFIEFSDFLSRYGFYPGAHIGIPLAVLGGVEAQFGEIMPALPKTGLDFLIATFPDNESVRFISDRVFGDRFRNYITILQVNRRGGDGTLIFSKMQEKRELTEEEKQLWADARREVGWYSAGFEQFAMFRMRTDEQYKMYEESAKVIEEMTGYTPEQQDWLRKHGYRLWDMVGGMSPTEQAVLQELEYYKWIGNVRPLLPGRQQTILNQIELAWDDVRRYSESLLEEKLTLQRDFLAGRIGSQDYGDQLSATYSKQREHVDRKMEEYPLMDLDNRIEYYKKYNIPQPVLHPMRELMNLYFEIELEDKIDEETGEKVKDWDKFWAMREAVETAIPDDYREEWDDYLKRNSTSLEQLRREHNQYVKPYNALWERILEEYTPKEQEAIKEHQYLLKTGTGLERRAEIEDMVREATGRKLISNFRSDISEARQALRYANPFLDAVLYYWGRTTTFQTPQAEETYKQLAKDTGKSI